MDKKGDKKMTAASGLELQAGLFRNTDKNGNVYYSGKSEGGDEFVMFRNTYWKEGSNKPYFRLMKRTGDGPSKPAMED